MTLRSRSIQSGLERHPRGTVDDRLRDALLCLLVDPHVRLSANPTQVTPIDVIKRRCIVRDMDLPRLRDPPLKLGCCDSVIVVRAKSQPPSGEGRSCPQPAWGRTS
jgi:hypothetical protein